MRLSNLKPVEGSSRDRKRLGRGPGSGTGSQSGRGHKGQKARSGYKNKYWNEGGQMPLARRLPKRGFTNIFKTEYQIINVGNLAKLDGTEFDKETLLKSRLLRNKTLPFKVLGNGEINRPITIKANCFSESAKAKIEKAGGKVEVMP
ncbi:MAG: 50S ribosomal protein L15 [candidate division Zixibacteria bacterium]|jgi:large subunit ribosomal protein L15|nr:50S ribosomal protein L15 [candidate division Zixibacteria bacterium]